MAGNCPECVRKLYRSGTVPLKSWPANWDRERGLVYISAVSRAENLGQKAQNLNARALRPGLERSLRHVLLPLKAYGGGLEAPFKARRQLQTNDFALGAIHGVNEDAFPMIAVNS